MNTETKVGKIESGIPIPPRTGAGRGPLRVAIENLKAGQSFEATSSTTLAHSTARAAGVKIATRKTGEGKIRIWRK